MQFPRTPSPSPTLEDTPILPQSSFSLRELSRAVCAGATSTGDAYSLSGDSQVEEPIHPPAVAHPAEMLQSGLSSSTEPPPREMLRALLVIAEVCGRLDVRITIPRSRTTTAYRPPTPPPPCPGSPEHHPGLSCDGYVYDLDAWHGPIPPGSYVDMIVHPFMPTVSYVEGPLHRCAFILPETGAGASLVNTDHVGVEIRHGVLMCEICLEAFDDEDLAFEHAHVHDQLDVFFCSGCSGNFASAPAREKHWYQQYGCREEHGLGLKTVAADIIKQWHKDVLEADHRLDAEVSCT